MIGFHSLSDYVFPKFWLKRWPDFCFSSCCTYLSLFSIRGGWGWGGEGATSWWVPHFFCQSWTEISLSRAGLHTNKISNNSCSFKGKSKYYRFSFTLRQDWCWLMQKFWNFFFLTFFSILAVAERKRHLTLVLE